MSVSLAGQRLCSDEGSAEGLVHTEGFIFAGGQSTIALGHETHVN
jgi:hypothetical protein